MTNIGSQQLSLCFTNKDYEIGRAFGQKKGRADDIAFCRAKKYINYFTTNI
jgi:hypothetical protein